jgi:hypothetical protein
MREYDFTEATPFIEFLDKHRDKIIGSRLKSLYVHIWPEYRGCVFFDCPAVLELDAGFVVISYYLPSDIGITFGTKEEIMQIREAADVIDGKYLMVDYYRREFDLGIKKEEIENCKIVRVTVDRFSNAFECNPCTGEMRPEGGDYFSTIRLFLDSGITLCFCGEDSISDGYMDMWCE